jgi:membrane associated rhomboid family serine protease
VVEVRIGDEVHELTYEEFEARVRSGRITGDVEVRFRPITGDRFLRASELELVRGLRDERGDAFRRSFTRAAPPLLTALLVGVQIRVWWLSGVGGLRERVIRDGTNFAPAMFEDGEVYRLLAMGFAHTALGHLMLNMLWLAYCGFSLERALGRANVLLLYVASVVGGSALASWFTPETPSLGASGGVFGLLGAVVVFGMTRSDVLPDVARRTFGLAMLPYAVVMFAFGLLSETTDNWSHFGGLATGSTLAFFLDPPDIERRSGFNRRTRAVVVAALVTLAGVVGWFGPRIEPLVDSEVARATSSRGGAPVIELAEVVYAVPRGWRPSGGSAGIAGFSSPSPRSGERVGRSFGVRSIGRDGPSDLDRLADDFEAGLERVWGEAERVRVDDVTFAGRPGRHAVFRITGGAATVHWYGAVRGLLALEAAFTTSTDTDARLAPLRDRLVATVVWNDPMALLDAIALVERSPASRQGRLTLAEERARVGEVDVAKGILDDLLSADPSDVDAWRTLVDVVSVWAPAEADAVYERALAVDLAPLTADVALRMRAAGRDAEAVGLAEIAWARSPGDRSVARARRRLDLPTRVLDGRAAHLPPPAVDLTPSLAAAATAGAARLAAERDLAATAARGVAVGEARALDALFTLRFGAPDAVPPLGPEAPSGADPKAAAVEELALRVAEGQSPRWSTPDLDAALLATLPDPVRTP